MAVLLNAWCNYKSKDRLGSLFLVQGVQIAKDLRLFRRLQRQDDETDDESPHTHRGRAIIAWGIFNWQAYVKLMLNEPKILLIKYTAWTASSHSPNRTSPVHRQLPYHTIPTKRMTKRGTPSHYFGPNKQNSRDLHSEQCPSCVFH